MTQATDTAAPGTVRARAVTYTGHGGYDVIRIAERDVRPPAEGEVRIRVAAAAVNPTDIAWRDPGRPGGVWPLVPGMDAAGTIEAVGPGVTRLKVGDHVMAVVLPLSPDGGAQASFIVVPEAAVVTIPAGASLSEASTLPMNGLTALHALERGVLEPGSTFAVTGGAGLLASYAIAIARSRGIRVVADATPEETDLVRGYGADIVVPRGDDYAAAVRREVPAGVDALLDTALLGEKAFGAIRDGGVYLPVRGWGDTPAERDIRIKPVWVSKAMDRTDWLELLRGMAEQGAIRLRVAGEYPLEQVVEAQRALVAGGLRGRPVILF